MSVNHKHGYSSNGRPRYQVGKTGRIVVMRLDDGEDIRNSILEVAKNENIGSALETQCLIVV